MKTACWAPPTEFLDSLGLGSAGGYAFLTSSQGMLLLLDQGPHFKNHCFKGCFITLSFLDLS